MEPAIKIENLTKTYRATGKKNGKQKEALKNVSLSINKGSIYGLLGPNGAGKSTLINILAGLTIKTSGKVSIGGIDIDERPRNTRFMIGVVPQEVVLDPFFSITELLEYHAGYYGVPKNKRRTKELLKAFSLSDKSAVNSRRLSGGMKRRVLIAKALVHNPPIVVLDEPTAGVDVELRAQLWDYVRELNKQGTTILLTTHYLEEAEKLCDRIGIIDHGKIIADNSPEELMKLMDNKQIILQFSEKIREIPEGLKKFDVEQTDSNKLLIRYKTSEISAGDLLNQTKNAGLTIMDIKTEEPDLEDVFRHLVKSGNKKKN